MISVLTVNYWSAREVIGLADSLRKFSRPHGESGPIARDIHPASSTARPNTEIELIVTNNSPAEQLDLQSDDRLHVKIINADNVGFGRGVNLAYRHARGDILMLANPDVRATEHTLARAESYLGAHPDVGILLPLLRYPDGQIQPSIRRFYTWPVVLYARSPLRALISPPSFWKHYLCENVDRLATTDVDWGLGAVMFLRRADIENGRIQGSNDSVARGSSAESPRRGLPGRIPHDEDGRSLHRGDGVFRGVEPGRIFDERFFMYFEDVDLCYRVWQSGRRVVYRPDVECIHGHHRHSANPFSPAGLYHLRSLTSFIMKYRGLPSRQAAVPIAPSPQPLPPLPPLRVRPVAGEHPAIPLEADAIARPALNAAQSERLGPPLNRAVSGEPERIAELDGTSPIEVPSEYRRD